MRPSEFLQRFVDGLRPVLPDAYRSFEPRLVGGRLVKLSYGVNGVHYELWLRDDRYVEIGLHFEADAETNARWLSFFSEHAFDVISQLGPQVEIEQWTKSWARVHQTLPYATPDERLLSAAIERMTSMIGVLQPMMEET